MAYGSGNWFGLPEFGLTERFGGNANSVSNAVNKSASKTSQPVVYGPQMSNASVISSNSKNTSKPASSSGSSSSGSSSYSSGYSGSSGGSSSGSSKSSSSSSAQKAAEKAARIAAEEAAKREAQVRSGIRGLANNLRSSYDQWINQIPTDMETDIKGIQDAYRQVKQGIGSAWDSAKQGLDVNRQKVDQYKQSAIQDLVNNLNNVYRATNMQLGAVGAGDSSASQVMAPYAFAKMGSQARSGIMRDANSQFTDIDAQEIDTNNQYQQSLSNIDLQSTQEVEKLRQDYRAKKQEIEQLKMNASVEEQRALQNLDESLLSQAYNRLNEISNWKLNMQNQVQTWAQNRLAQLNDAKLSLQNTANFDPQQIVASEISGLGDLGMGYNQGGYDQVSALAKARKKYNI